MVLGPLLGLFLVSLGNGFISSLTSLRLDAAHVSSIMIGAISSAYFVGLTVGAVTSDRLIGRIGHIRAYSGFASLTAITFLLQGLVFDPWFWLLLRLINGWAMVGIYLVVESWLLLAGDPKSRGRLLAIYMIALYGSIMLAQALLGRIDAWGSGAPFMLAGVLGSMSVLPMVILPRISPEVGAVEPLMPQHLIRMTPAGVVGSFGSGVGIAAVYTLLPIYLQREGLAIGQVGQLMASTICGAMLLQYPVGRWSDRRDRQSVLLALSAACALLSLLVLLLPAYPPLLMLLLFLVGGCIFAIYPVAVSHSADRADAQELVRVIQGMLLINSVGSAISPMVISPLMNRVGGNGLFWAFLVLHAALAAFFLWRHRHHPASAPAAPFAAAAQMTPIGAEIRVTQELARAAASGHPEQAPPAP
ncbi:MFS transporter [Herbaspirillum sp. YR522]|uniref:MFS transporter n=1 Tax=Herbaspirillum sp. YR522 TaxID=1144342 RepID=UPI00026FBBEB|nr:MFS transporter [Herbaspirillum sp. YR522]EJN08684.1 arabinose efflux permease family protein [Herbaspirillum sp. YR522]